MNTNSEIADFYKIKENNIMIKYLTLYDNETLEHYIESNKVIPNNLEGVEVLIGFLVNKQTGAFSRLCFYSEITIGENILDNSESNEILNELDNTNNVKLQIDL
jgi:hypothetical protein